VQAQELIRAQAQQEELMQRLQEAQDREAAAASQTQALSSQLEEARDAHREVGDGSGRGSSWHLL
jgi:serine/threonine-protein kinase MRCK